MTKTRTGTCRRCARSANGRDDLCPACRASAYDGITEYRSEGGDGA